MLTALTPNAGRFRLRLTVGHTAAAAVDITALTKAGRLAPRGLVPFAGTGAEPSVWPAEVDGKMGGTVVVGDGGLEFRRNCT